MLADYNQFVRLILVFITYATSTGQHVLLEILVDCEIIKIS
jgi:hypothetical protein